MTRTSLLLTVAPPSPNLALICAVGAALGLLALGAGQRRWRGLAIGLLILTLALGVQLHVEFRRDAGFIEEIVVAEGGGAGGALTPEWRQAYIAVGLALLLAGAGAVRAFRTRTRRADGDGESTA